VTAGVILLFFIAILVAFFWNKFRKRAGLGVSSRTWMGTIITVAIVAALLYGSSLGH
jgi:hypothetical protein